MELQQSMCIYLKNDRAKFYPDPIWNDGALAFFWKGRPNKKKENKKNKENKDKNNKMSSDMRSVPGPKQLRQGKHQFLGNCPIFRDHNNFFFAPLF